MDFSTHVENISQTLPSMSDPNSHFKSCFSLNFFCCSGLSFEIPIIRVFSFLNSSIKRLNSTASLVHPDVFALGKKNTTVLYKLISLSINSFLSVIIEKSWHFIAFFKHLSLQYIISRKNIILIYYLTIVIKKSIYMGIWIFCEKY